MAMAMASQRWKANNAMRALQGNAASERLKSNSSTRIVAARHGIPDSNISINAQFGIFPIYGIQEVQEMPTLSCFAAWCGRPDVLEGAPGVDATHGIPPSWWSCIPLLSYTMIESRLLVLGGSSRQRLDGDIYLQFVYQNEWNCLCRLLQTSTV